MRLTVKLFAGARELAGCPSIELDLAEPATVDMVRSQLLVACPALEPLLPHALIAVDQQYADDTTPIAADSELACIPPVSGG